MNQSEFAKLIGVTRQAVSKMKKEGILIIKNGKIDPTPTISNLEKLGRLEKAKTIDKEIEEIDIKKYTALRYKNLEEQHRKRKLENDMLERTVINVEEAKEIIGKFLNPIVQDMDTLPHDFKNTFPLATLEMMEYLSEYMENIKIKSQKRDILK